jgi:hypothetical protein
MSGHSAPLVETAGVLRGRLIGGSRDVESARGVDAKFSAVLTVDPGVTIGAFRAAPMMPACEAPETLGHSP